MRILEYDEADPEQVLQFNLLMLDFPLSSEQAAQIRCTDPRPLPCLTLNALEAGAVLGQVGIFRLPMISIKGREDVGGLWAPAIHTQHARRIARPLLAEAHARMAAGGLRFSTLGIKRTHPAYELARQQGYEELDVWATALASWETAHQPTRLHARPLGAEGYDLVEHIFQDIARDYLGFAWRHLPCASLRTVEPTDIWVLSETDRCVGYAVAHSDAAVLSISSVLLRQGVDIAEALAAITAQVKAAYVAIEVARPAEIASLRRAGYQVTCPTLSGFLMRPLTPEVTFDDARLLFGIGTDRFLISWMDVTGEPHTAIWR